MQRKRLVYLLVALLIGTLLIGCGTQPAAQPQQPASEPATQGPASTPVQPITLKAISFLPTNHPLVATLPTWIEKVEEATGGVVTVDWVGGPEVTPAMEQIEAVRNGVVDVNFNVTAYFEGQAPELRVFNLSQHSPWEERENGFYDWAVDRHSKLGVRYVGRWLYNQPFYLWTNDPVSQPSDLSGRKLRTAALYDRFMRELGAVPVTVNTPEVYTALQTGVAEGFGWPILGAVDSGWTEKTKYLIDHPFFNQNGVILINEAAWAKIPADLQEKIVAATAEYEHAMADHFNKVNAEERQKLQQAGVTFVKFPESQAQQYVQTAYDVEWQWLETQVPDQVSELKKVASK